MMSWSALQVPTTAMRVWRGLSARLGLDRPCRAEAAGELGRLRKEVRTCEYGDVHVMWEMLSNPSSGGRIAAEAMAATRQARTTRRKPAVVVAAWSRLAFYCCGL